MYSNNNIIKIKLVGLVGLGTMGKIIASRLVENKFEVIGYDISLEARRAAEDIGVKVTERLADIGERSDVVLLSLPGPQEVREVVGGENGLLSKMHSGQIIVDLSTVDPFTTNEVARKAKEKEVEYLDAPILGRPVSIGRWVSPVGGERKILEKCKPVLKTFCSKLVHVGPSGAGNTVKLINQLMFSTINAITAEVLAIAKKIGLSPEVVFNTISQSGAATVSGLFCEVGKKIVKEDFEPIFSIELLCKDNGLGIEMAKKYGAFPLISSYVQMLNEIANIKGLGNKDTAALIKVYEEFMNM